MLQPLNLSRRPFRNTRPVVRIAAGLWVVGGAVAVLNIWLYWGAFFGLEGRRDQAAELGRQIAEERQGASSARQALTELELGLQNQRVAYLNQRIWERSFPWSRLFEDLGEVLPDRVRVSSLSPREVVQRQRPSRHSVGAQAAAHPDRVRLEIRAIGEESDDLLELLDNIFASPLFEEPALPRESRQADGTILFGLSVRYLPGEAMAAGAAGAEVLPAAVAGVGAPEPAEEKIAAARSLPDTLAEKTLLDGARSERPEGNGLRPRGGATR